MEDFRKPAAYKNINESSTLNINPSPLLDIRHLYPQLHNFSNFDLKMEEVTKQVKILSISTYEQ